MFQRETQFLVLSSNSQLSTPPLLGEAKLILLLKQKQKGKPEGIPFTIPQVFGKSQLILANLLLLTITTTTFFTFVGRNLLTLSFLSARHVLISKKG